MESVTQHNSDPTARLITRPFLSVTLSALVFFMYIGIVIVTVPRFVEEELGAGEFGVGLTLAAFAAAAIVARPFLGKLGDRYGRRKLMMVGATIAGVAGALSGLSNALWQLLILRSITGLGEAAMFVGAATLIADLSPADRRAEAASYFSVAVFGGIGLGPVFGEWILQDDRYVLTFATAGLFSLAAAALVTGVPKRVDRQTVAPAAGARLIHRAAIWPGVVLASGVAAFSVFSAFLPDYARTVGLSGAGGLFLVYSAVCVMLRIVGAKVPERIGARLSVSIALITIALGLLIMAAVPEAWGLWVAAVVVGIGMAFMYPSLMAHVVNDVAENERASALSSFTMFFEVGTIVGGLALGGVGELLGKRVGFLGGSVVCLIGLSVLLLRVVPKHVEQTVPHSAARPAQLSPVAGD